MPGTDTYLGLLAFVDELVRCGLRDACTSPGSRSTPLVLGLAREPRLRATSHIDERSAAFFALGLAKATGIPAALACTSGTAAANYAPAVIEAHEARVPMIVLTADRPPELRGVGAGQTIDQVKLYGSAAKWYFEVDDHPASAARVRWLRQLACRAFYTAIDGRPGPVHLNFSLREPLVPDGDGGCRTSRSPRAATAAGRGSRARSTLHAASPRLLEGLESEVKARPRTIVVAGRAERDPRLGATVAAFAERAGTPLLAEPLSGARRGPAAIAHYDALLRDPEWAAAHAPELVLRVGTSPPPSRCAPGSRGDALQVSFDPDSAWQDPAGVVATIIGADPHATLEALAAALPRKRKDTSWLDDWHAADRAAARAIAETVGPAGLNEPRVAAELGTLLPAEATLIVASSMPVRDVETFFPTRETPFRVLSNRGANGIDGTVSTAFGVAAAARAPVVLLIGDVALAHDVGGLLAASRLGLKLVIVLIDNDGGGIFHFLPAAREGAEFVEHIATPHGLDFAHAAALYGCGYERADDVDAFRAALQRRWSPSARRSSACARTARRTSTCTGACGSPSGPPPSVAGDGRRPDHPARPAPPRLAPHDLEGHRRGRHRRGRQARPPLPRAGHRALPARDRPLRARAPPARLAGLVAHRVRARSRRGLAPRGPLSDDDHPIGYQALPRGVPVVSSDGVELGTVQKVLDNAREHIFDGIVMKTKNGRRFVDAPEVARITVRQVTLTIDSAAASELPEYRGAIEENLRRSARRWKRRLGR